MYYRRKPPAETCFGTTSVLKTRDPAGFSPKPGGLITYPQRNDDLMRKTFVLWNDEADGRFIKFVVDYSIDGDMLHVLDLQPIEVSTFDSALQTAKRKVPVRTERARFYLRSRFIEQGNLKPLLERIAQKHNLTVIGSNEL